MTADPVNAWPAPAKPAARVTLRLGGDRGDILTNISAGTRLGDSLFVAGDERAELDRLTLGEAGCAAH